MSYTGGDVTNQPDTASECTRIARKQREKRKMMVVDEKDTNKEYFAAGSEKVRNPRHNR